MALIFQYGSNTSSSRLNSSDRLCGDAKDMGLVCTSQNFELDFDVWSNRNSCAASDIREGAGRRIWGVLYEVPDHLVWGPVPAGRKTFDQIEGSSYQRRTIGVRRPDGTPVDGDVFTYTVRKPASGLKTSLDYVTHILAGLREHDAPEDYLAYVLARIGINNPALTLPLSLSVYCADVGSVVAGNFGWCASNPTTGIRRGTSMPDLAAAVARDLNAGVPVALGFECPLFVPISGHPERLTSARTGEGSRAWSAGAGCGALATGLAQAVWVLREIRHHVTLAPPVFLEWPPFLSSGAGLFLWEAFVSAGAKRDGHMADAEAAIEAFGCAMREPQMISAVSCAEECYSLIGAALLRTGWSTDISLLSGPCTVIRATKRLT